jgi:TolA-binding protein
MMKRILLGIWFGLLGSAPAWGLTADEQMRFADGIYLRGFYETAVGEYLALLRDNPDGSHVAAALYRTGECYRQMGNQAGAERFYKRVATEFSQSEQAPRANLRRAEAAIAEGRHADAAALLEPLLKANPAPDTAAAALYFLGTSRWKTGDRKGAGTAFESLLKDHGASPYVAYAALDLAALHADDKNNVESMTGWFETAVASASTPAIKAEALFRWGDWAYRQGRYQAAADTLQSLLVELPTERRARDALLAAGWSFYYLDRTTEALELSEKLTAQATDAETAASGVYLRANCLRKMNRDGEALKDYETVTRDYPSTPFASRAAYEIMATHFKRGEYEKALVAAPAQPASANETDVLWMRAESERSLGRIDLARGRYETLVKEFPKSPQAAPALLRLGEMARAAGRLEEAAGFFRRVADDYPKNEAVSEALKASALARQRAGDPAGALADWDALLTGNPDPESGAEARLQKALVQLELKKSPEALATLDALLQDDPDGTQTARAQYWRGVLLSEKSKWPQSEQALRACLSAGPDAQTAALARLRLAVVLQRQDRMDEAADQIDPLLADALRVAENPALVEWVARRRFDQGHYERAWQAATALGEHAREASWRQIGWYWAGTSQAQLGNDSAALGLYEKSVAEQADTREGAEAQLLLAKLELKAGRNEKAEARYAAAAQSATGDESLDLRARAYFGLGEVAEAAGQPDKASRHFMSVAVLFDDPEWTPHSLFRAGQLFGQTGKKAEQASAWKELKERYPDSGFAKQLESSIP